MEKKWREVFANVIRWRILTGGDYPVLPRWAQKCSHLCAHKRDVEGGLTPHTGTGREKTEQGDWKMLALNSRVMRPPAKDCQLLSEARRPKEGLSPRDSGKSVALLTHLVSDFSPPM